MFTQRLETVHKHTWPVILTVVIKLKTGNVSAVMQDGDVVTIDC